MAKPPTIHTGQRLPRPIVEKLSEIAEKHNTNWSALILKGAELVIESYMNNKNRHK